MNYAGLFNKVGLQVDSKSSDASATYAKGDGLRFRALHYDEPGKSKYELHIAIESNFDRWANSVDFIAPLPQSVEHMKKILAAVNEKIKTGHYDDGFGGEYRIEV